MTRTKHVKNYAKRTVKYFNCWRKFWQAVVCKFWYGMQFRLMYRIEIEGKENIPKNNRYIACANHLSALDPFLVAYILNRPVAYMAKKELFEQKFVCWMLDWEGAFAVNREKLEIATIKTALEVNKTNWVLGLFPQGTRAEAGTVKNIKKGFAGLARTTKCDILPIGIVGSQNRTVCPFRGKIKVKIGKIVPFNENLDEVVDEWGKSIQSLTGFEYIPAV